MILFISESLDFQKIFVINIFMNPEKTQAKYLYT